MHNEVAAFVRAIVAGSRRGSFVGVEHNDVADCRARESVDAFRTRSESRDNNTSVLESPNHVRDRSIKRNAPSASGFFRRLLNVVPRDDATIREIRLWKVHILFKLLDDLRKERSVSKNTQAM